MASMVTCRHIPGPPRPYQLKGQRGGPGDEANDVQSLSGAEARLSSSSEAQAHCSATTKVRLCECTVCSLACSVANIYEYRN